jgi:hypothetical protein
LTNEILQIQPRFWIATVPYLADRHVKKLVFIISLLD